ncbi:MAG TPA: ParA family protein [Syntrophorhabdus sp.]|nr:ParA family protein [Syntrophorhabdus sp.]
MGKILSLLNEKGGVGKTAVACQLAYFLVAQDKKVLFIDIDHQGNSTKSITLSKKALVSKTTSSRLLKEKVSNIEDASFVLVPTDEELRKMEKQPDKHNLFATNLKAFLDAVSPRFEYVVFDTNPNYDIRSVAALVVSDYVLSPIQLNQEALDGVGSLIGSINKVRQALNNNLQLIGILPNLVEHTPFQKANFTQLVEAFSQLLIVLDGQDRTVAYIPTTTAIAEAQASGAAIWEIKKTSAREAWRKIKPFFMEIYDRMERGGTKHA